MFVFIIIVISSFFLLLSFEKLNLMSKQNKTFLGFICVRYVKCIFITLFYLYKRRLWDTLVELSASQAHPGDLRNRISVYRKDFIGENLDVTVKKSALGPSSPVSSAST